MNIRAYDLLKLFAGICLFSICCSASVPQSRHVWLITEENHSYEDVAANMPYLVSLGNQYGTATQSYSDMHNSLPALMHLVAGQTVTLDDTTTTIFNVDNLASHINNAGLSWRSYQESLPFAGDPVVDAFPYVKRHNPLAYFTDTNTPTQSLNWLPYPVDITTVPETNFNYVTPNLLNDAHDGTMQAADLWLSRQVPAIMARPEFQPGGDGILIITFDEGNLDTDNRCSPTVSNGCGGRVMTIIAGPQIKRGFRSSVWHNQESVLKTVCGFLALGACPGAASSGNDLGEFFESAPQLATSCVPQSANLTLNICSPAAGATVADSVHFVASTQDSVHPVQAINVYVDSVLRYVTFSKALDTQLSLPPGTHNIVIRAWDSSGAFFSSAESVTVNPCTAPAGTVAICAPDSGSTVDNPVHIQAGVGATAHPITGMVLYVDSVERFWTASNKLDTFLNLNNGSHTLVIRAWDSSGAFFSSTRVVGVF